MTKAEIRKLDTLTSQLCRDRGYCQRCWATDTLECSHIIGRKIRATRWQQGNVLCLCKSCHAKMHDRPTLHAEFARHLLGDSHVKTLNDMSLVLWPSLKMSYEEVHGMLEASLGEWAMRVLG